MVYEASANPRGPYWAEEWVPREHCYSIIPLKDGKPENLTEKVWCTIFSILGRFGYLFRDSGHDINHAVVSLNKPIKPKHIRTLANRLKITKNDGAELGFC